MSLNYVTLTLDLYDGQGNAISSGVASFTPSVQLADTTDHELIALAPVPAVFHAGGLPTVKLLATDNGVPLPAGWAWTVSFSGVPGNPAGFSFFLPFSGGSTQYLSSLSPVSTAVTQFAQNPMTSAGDMIEGGSGGTPARLAIGTSGQVLTVSGGLPSWQTPSPAVPVTIAQGGTGQTAQQAAIDALAGAQTAAQFLRGNGTHVVMSAVQAADLPAATTSAQGAVILDGTAADIQPDGVQAAGSKGQAADAKHVHPYQPWQFLPEAYGAKGDGKVVGDVVTNGTTTITSASASFTGGDAGKYIMIHGANGATAGPLLTTISSVTNSTTAVLAAAAGASVSACPAVYGTDDTAAINSAISAAKTYALAHSYFAEILFAAKIYILGTGPTQQTSPAQYNTQILIPYPDLAGATQKLVIALTGAGDAGYCQYWQSLIPNVAGTALVSMTTAPSTISGTYGAQSVIGGPSAGGAFTGSFANTKVAVKGISVWCSIYTNQYAFDFGYLSAMRAQQSSAHIFAPPGVNGSAVLPYLNNITATAFKNSIGSGWRTPADGNNDAVHMDDLTAEGYECAYRVFDHAVFPNIRAIYSDVVMKWDNTQGTSGTAHGLFGTISAEAYNGGLLATGGSCQVDINWDAEGVPASYDVSDSSGAFFGHFRYGDKVDNRAPVVIGASNLKVVNCNLGPGPWAGAPAVPSSGTAQQNTAWRDATVWITASGPFTITVDTTVLGEARGGLSGVLPVRVPSGHSITLAYPPSTFLSWAWVLD